MLFLYELEHILEFYICSSVPLKSSLCDYNDANVLVSGTIKVAELAADRGNNGIEVVFKHCAPFTDCISEINNRQIMLRRSM